MKKTDLGQTLAILANLGVIAGIIFLAVELNQNQDLARAQMRNEISIAIQEMSRGDIESPIPEILIREESGETLSEVEELRLGIWRNMWLRHFENLYFQFREGLYSEEIFEANSLILRNDFRLETYLCEYGEGFDPEFYSYAQSVFQNGCDSGGATN